MEYSILADSFEKMESTRKRLELTQMLVELFEKTALQNKIPIQRSAHSGALTDLSYVQLVGKGVACIDVGFPMRYSHSSIEVCDLNDLVQLTNLLEKVINKIDKYIDLQR